MALGLALMTAQVLSSNCVCRTVHQPVRVPRRFYVKLDDDVVWLADGAIEAMLEEKLRGRFLYLSANIVNHSSLGLVRRPNDF